MFYYVYILQSLKNNQLYIGYTSDLKQRLKKHNAGQNKATRPFIPYKLIFYEAFLNRTDAENREVYLKSGYGRKSIKAMLSNYSNNQDLKSTEKAYEEAKKEETTVNT